MKKLSGLLYYSVFHLFVMSLVLVGFKPDSPVSEPSTGELKEGYPHVEWRMNWPNSEKKHHPAQLKDYFNSIVFGIKQPVLSTPVSILATNPDDLWVLDQGNHAIFRIQDKVGHITQALLKSEVDLSSLVGICTGPNSGVLFTDSHSQQIYFLGRDNKKLQVLNAGLKLEQPTGIAYSQQRKEIWVVETRAHRISVLNEKGELIKQIGHRGILAGEFNYPTHIWIDNKGFIYVTDAMNFRIQVLDFEGRTVSIFGSQGDASGYFASPKGVATDSLGNIYVVDALFHVVQVFDSKGNLLYRFGNQGHGNGEFWIPSGIFIDKEDNIYIADTYNSRVQVFQLVKTASK